MNIAYISADFGVPVAGFKGASIHVREMVNALAAGGHSLFLLTPAINEKKEPLKTDPAMLSKLIRAEVLHVQQSHKHLELLQEIRNLEKLLQTRSRMKEELRNLFYNLTFYGRALDYLKRKNIDFVYERYSLFAHAGIRVARQLGIPHILEMNAPLAYEQEKMRGLEMKDLAQKAERSILQDTDQVLVVSEKLREYVSDNGVDASRIHVLPNAVDVSRFTAKDSDRRIMRDKLGLSQKCVIGFVGTLKPWHGTQSLFEAFVQVHRELPQTHLLIVGDGPGRDELEKFVLAHQLRKAVTFTGSVDHLSIPGHIAAMDITVAPYTPNENFYYSPIKVFEYQAMAKPVVAGAIGQLTDLIANGETGLLYKPGDVGQLIAALRKLIQDPELGRDLGRLAKASVLKDRTWTENARQVVALAHGLKRSQRSHSTDAAPVTETI